MSSSSGIKVKVSTDGGATYKDYVEQQQQQQQTTTSTTTPTTNIAKAYDSNGIEYVQPLASDGYQLKYQNETTSFTKNFRSDGSMRCDFKGTIRNSVMVAGYFKVTGSDTNEEVAAKLNGGPHNSTNPDYADVVDLGIVNFAGTRSRVRWEKTHPQYSSSIYPTYKELPITDIRSKWRGFIGMKVNLDTDKDGKPDKLAIIGMVDVGGLNTSNKPVNNWKITFKRIFAPSEVDLKSLWTPYVATIGKPELSYQTLRIDQQSQSAWTSTSNPPYKYVTCKEIIVVSG